MKIYLVRHGETDWNQAGRLQGQTDIDLDAQGFAQAAEAAERLKEVPFEIAFCSPLIRARHTAETIVGERKITLTTDERLRELNFGPWEGTDVRKIREGANSPFTDPGSYLPPEGAESFAQLYARSGEFVKQVLLPLEGTYETMIRIIIGAKNCGAIRPVSSPFLATIRPTSPRFIIPTPILSESGILNLQSFAVPPQPITFVKSATATSAIENQSIERLKSLKLV